MSEYTNGAVIALIGAVIGMVITKSSEFIQITDRQKKRANKPIYRPHNMYEKDNLNAISPNDPDKNFFTTRFELDELITKGCRDIKMTPGKNCKLSNYTSPIADWPDVDVYVKDDKKKFSFSIIYYKDGYKYKDYWIGCMQPNVQNFYNVSFKGPFTYIEFVKKS